MSKMKYSGVEWIGEIPKEWNYSKFKYIYNVKKAKLPDELETEYNSELLPYLSMEYIRDNSVKPYYSRKGTFCTKNDLLLLWDGSNAGEIIYNHPSGFASSTCAILNLKKNINELYSNYYMKFLEGKLRENTNGMGIPHVDAKYLNNLLFLIPCINEQKLIAYFLDKKISNLDNILSDLNNQLEILNDYKKELITEKVTENNKYTIEVKKGRIHLNFENQSKIVRVKNVLNGITDGTHGTFDRVYNGEYLLSAKNVFETGLKIGENESLISYKDYKDIIKCGYPQKNDLLMCCVGTIGRTMVYKENKPFAFQRSVLFIRVDNNKILPEFLNYSMNSNYMLEQEKVLVNKSAQDGIYQGTVKNMYLYLPALNKQKEIVDYLDKKCEQIDKIIEEKQKQIQKIEEYKKSVIYEYVTGKKRVEGAEELYG